MCGRWLRAPEAAWRTVRQELAAYGGGLAEKREILALNKADALSAEELAERRQRLAEAAGRAPFVISGATGEGVEALLKILARELREIQAEAVP